MPILNTATYEVTYGVVAITFPSGEIIHMNEKTLRVVIDNIHRNRDHYVTEAAFQEALSVYQGALKLLNGGAE